MKPEKIAPELIISLEDYRQEGEAGLSRHLKTLGLVSAQGSPKPPRSVVFIHCHEEAIFDGLRDRYGIRVNQPKGKVRTAFLPLESLEPLSDDPAVERIIPSRYLRLTMDVAIGKVNLPTFKSSSGLSGQGVIVGIIDSGIDPNHPAFKGRILRIWDQTLPGPGVAEGGYGVELTQALLTVSRDTVGHGTHVAGIAAGSGLGLGLGLGSGVNSLFGGVAPRAELVIVKSDLMDAHIADGIRYIFRVAGELRKPAVINLSLGGQGDAHDGSDSLSEVIDSESGSGRIICCAAGNEGNDNIHAQITLPTNATRSIRFRIPFRIPSNMITTAWLNGWYPGASSFEVSIRTPGGFVTPFQRVILVGSSVKSYSLIEAQVRIATPDVDLANGEHNFFVQIRGASPNLFVKGGVWQLRVNNVSSASSPSAASAASVASVASAVDGRLDVWALDDQPSSEMVFSGNSVKDSIKIGSPGAAKSAITVASYTTKVGWTDIDGKTQAVGLDLDSISDFSSEGPLRNNLPKPDVAAPGAMIVSALSADSIASRAEMVNMNYLVMAGTSMATPFVSGVVALLLERNPTLDPDGVKSLLRASSSIPGQPSGSFNAKWGFGLINAMKL